jgi:NADH dehydrogenase/NADH:ubiquinone oxidoreductase subunit G
MVTLSIDGQLIHVKHHTPILQASKMLEISIPTLCYHEALKPYGSCRLCMVEIIRGKRSKLVTSCNYPAEEGLSILTNSERVKNARKIVVELLLARCPNVPVIQRLAQEMGVKASAFKKKDDQWCILCGLCVRACEEIVGVSAINFADRGIERRISTPFGIESDVCIGCGSCTYICPTSCIEMVGEPGPAGNRTMNMGNLDLYICPDSHECKSCKIDHEFHEEMKRVVERFRS